MGSGILGDVKPGAYRKLLLHVHLYNLLRTDWHCRGLWLLTDRVHMTYLNADERASLIPDRDWFPSEPLSPAKPVTGRAVIDGLAALLEGRITRMGKHLPPWFAAASLARFTEFQFLFTRVVLLELRLARMLGALPGDDSRARYASFITLMRTAAYQEYLATKYPVLERYVEAQLEHHARAAEHIIRVVDEWEGGPSASITSVEFIGDPHHDGRQGAIVQLRGGPPIVVKPRASNFDSFFAELVDLVNPRLRYTLRTARTEQVGEYTVSEWLKESGDTPQSPYAYGAWLAIAHYHNLIDLHYENFISTVDGPVPIDFECAFSPSVRVDPAERSQPVRGSREPLWRVGLLPRVSATSTVELRWSPLANNANRAAGAFQIVQLDGTDEAHLRFEPDSQIEAAFESTVLAAHGDYEGFAAGFTDAQKALSSLTDQVRGLRERHHIEFALTRLVRKPTRFYSDVLRRTFHPRFLVDVASHEGAVRDLVVRSGDPARSVAGGFEVERMCAGFIPAYYCPVGQPTVLADGRPIDQPIVSGLAAHEARLRELADEKLSALDRRHLRQMLVSLGGAPWGDIGSLREPPATRLPDPLKVIHERIASNLWTGTSNRDRVSWHNLIDAGNGTFAPEEASYDLYNGAAGTLLALLSTPGSMDTDDRIARVVDDMVANTLPWLATAGRFGAYSGAAGSAYAAWNAHACGFLSRNAAAEFSYEVLTESVRRSLESREWDLLSGSAGLLLLLARFRDADVLDRGWCESQARDLLDVLDRTRLAEGDMPGSWWPGPDMDGGIGGLAHGVAGVALAAAQWPELELARALAEASASSQRHLRRGAALWRDTRPYMQHELADAWCHGAGGILLADQYDHTLAEADDLASWSEQDELNVGRADLTLCHGLSGRVLTAATLLGRDHPYSRAYEAQLREHVAGGWEAAAGGHLIELSDSLFTGQSGALIALSAFQPSEQRVGNPLILSMPKIR